MFGNSHFKSYKNNGFEFLNISTDKDNADTLVFLHGLFGGLSNYDALIKELDGYNIFVPAIPIHDFDSGELSIKNLTEWLHDFFETLEINRPTLLGNSLGGHLALNYVVDHPDNVSSLVLTGSSGLQEKDFGSTVPRRNDREYIRKQAALTFYDDLIDEVLLDNIMDVISSPSRLRNVLAITRDTHEFTVEEFLPEISHEVLLIWGKNDEITPPEVAREFHQKLPNSRLRWIDKCGHAPMMEHPKTFALFLNEFLLELQNNRNNNPTSDYEENYSHL
jgi:pimeloyl-ACP methyl ester carboxylesterase